MFASITWGTYISGLVAVLILYYGYVAIRYYSFEIKSLLSGKKLAPAAKTAKNGQKNLHEDYEHLYGDVEGITSSIRPILIEAGQGKLTKTEFLEKLRPFFSQYTSLKGSPFESAISELVVTECSRMGAAIVSEDDIDGLWDQV